MRYHLKKHHAEFELDLAPLLAVMVKLVPVLLISSAFVQFNLIESDLNPSVQNAMQATNDAKDSVKMIVKKHSVEIISKINGKNSNLEIAEKNGDFQYSEIYTALKEIKLKKPDLFSMTLKPDENSTQQEIIKLIDLSKKSKGSDTFEFNDPKTKLAQQTDLMFPKINFEK